MGYLLGELLPRNVRVVHFGSRTSKLAPIFEPPCAIVLPLGVCADPPSLYLCAIWRAASVKFCK